MRSFFGGSSDPNEKNEKSTTSSMFSYFSGERRPSQPQVPQQQSSQPQQIQSKNVPGFQTPQKPLQQGQQQGQNSNQPPSSQQSQPSSQQQSQQGIIDPTNQPLKIKLSSPTLAINTPILCHGYGNQDGIFCWYRISPSNPFYLITTTLQPSYTPSIDDANNIIVCQFKPDNGLPSEYARIGPLRLPPEVAHSVIRLMQNKQFINSPLTYINSKGIESGDIMKKWIHLITQIQELEVKKQVEIKNTNEKLKIIKDKIQNEKNDSKDKITTITPTATAPPEQSTSTQPLSSTTTTTLPQNNDEQSTLSNLELEQLALTKTKYNPNIDHQLALVHQELHSLIISDSFNPIIRHCPVQNAMESHNIKHLQDYILTIDNNSLELVFTPPTLPDEDGTTSTNTQVKSKSVKKVKKIVEDGNMSPLSEEEDADSEDEDHSLITHHKNRSSMGDLLSFLSSGVGSTNPNEKPIQSTKSLLSSDDDDSDNETEDEPDSPKNSRNNNHKSDDKDEIQVAVNDGSKDIAKDNDNKNNSSTASQPEQQESTTTTPVKKTISKSNELLLWNSIKIPNIPLSNAVIFTTRHDIVLPLDKNKLPSTSTTSSSTSTTTPTNNTINNNNNQDEEIESTITYTANKLLFVLDVRTYFVYTFYFENPSTRDHYGLALRAMSEKLHSKRTIPTISLLTNPTTNTTPSNITPNPISNQNQNNTSAAMTTIIPPGPIFKSWLPFELQQKYKIVAPNGLTTTNNTLKSPSTTTPSSPLSPPTLLESPSIQQSTALIGITPAIDKQANYFNDIEPLSLLETISQTSWFQELHPGYIPPLPTTESSSTTPTSPTSPQQLSTQQQSSSIMNQDNVLPDVALLFKVYQYDQDTLITLLQDKIQFLYQRNLNHKKQSQLLTKQQHLISLELEIYKEKYYNERAYNDELVQSYYDSTATSILDTYNNNINNHQQPIISRQLFRNQQHQNMVKSNSILQDTRGFDLSGNSNNNNNNNNNSQLPITPQKGSNTNNNTNNNGPISQYKLKPSKEQSQHDASLSSNPSKESILTSQMLQSSQSTPQLAKSDLSTDTNELQDKVLQQQQIIQQLKRDNKQLIATNMTYKEQASLANEYEAEILQQKDIIKQLQNKVGNSKGNDNSLISSQSSLNSTSPAIATLQTTIVELTQQTQTQQQDIALKERKLTNYESQIQKLTQQLHLAYQQQQDLITKGIKVEQEKLRQQFNSTEQELNTATNINELLRNENNLYKTQASLMESLNIQQHVEIETLETTIETLQTSIVGLINENEYLKKQQQAFISLQQQFKQQQAQLLLLQHENVTLSNTIQEHQQHIVNLQQQKQLMRNQSIVGNNNNNQNQNQTSILTSQQDAEKMSNLVSELQYYKQKCFSLSTSLERLMRKHHQEMIQSNNNNNMNGNNGPNGNNNINNKNGKKNPTSTTSSTTSTVNGANTALIDPLNDTSDQELLYKIYTQQSHTMTHEQLCKEYKIMIKQLELLIETNKLLRFDIKQVRLQHDALQQQYNERIKYNTNPTNSNYVPQPVTIQTLQRDLLEKQLQETKHLVTTLTFVLQDKQQHIDLIKNTNKQLVIELDYVKKQIHDFHQQQQEQQHLYALQQVANGNNNQQINNNNLSTTLNNTGIGNDALGLSHTDDQSTFHF